QLSASEAKKFLLKEESYLNYDLPRYFTFKNLLSKIDKTLTGKSLSDFCTAKTSASDFEGVNYQLFSNKDGKYAWRPFQIIHPAIYVSLVHNITQMDNWELIKKRFEVFFANKKIECHSLPMVSLTKNKKDKEVQIYNWWQQIEQRSVELAIE